MVGATIVDRIRQLPPSSAGGKGQPALSGALSRALCYLRARTATGAGGSTAGAAQPKILCLQGSQDVTAQYIACMNCIFSAQVQLPLILLALLQHTYEPLINVMLRTVAFVRTAQTCTPVVLGRASSAAVPHSHDLTSHGNLAHSMAFCRTFTGVLEDIISKAIIPIHTAVRLKLTAPCSPPPPPPPFLPFRKLESQLMRVCLGGATRRSFSRLCILRKEYT